MESTPEIRRAYREMFFTTPGIGEFPGAIILQDETIHQRSASGPPLLEVVVRQGSSPVQLPDPLVEQ